MDAKVGLTKHLGSCHCGTVRFEVVLDASSGTRCNCSICTKLGVTGAIVKPDAFKLLSGEAALLSYGDQQAARYFCKTCGIHCYGKGHLEQLGGDFVGVYLNTLNDIDLGEVKLGYFDGRHDNWMAGLRDKPWPTLTPAA